ncbi:MAG: hypothetical protein DRJ47_05270 [Thermoprotei archaeon]|nr:MAG: hypothetical protein DRJ47_05270 [Thermoprotei archaeon]
MWMKLTVEETCIWAGVVVARALFLKLWELVWASPSAASPLVGGSPGATFRTPQGTGYGGAPSSAKPDGI